MFKIAGSAAYNRENYQIYQIAKSSNVSARSNAVTDKTTSVLLATVTTTINIIIISCWFSATASWCLSQVSVAVHMCS